MESNINTPLLLDKERSTSSLFGGLQGSGPGNAGGALGGLFKSSLG